MPGGLVGDGELTKVPASHLGLDLNVGERLAVVDADDGANHLGHDDHVAEVRADGVGLLVLLGLLLGLPKPLDQGKRLALKTPREATTSAGSDHLGELSGGNIQKVVKINTTVRELLESPTDAKKIVSCCILKINM